MQILRVDKPNEEIERLREGLARRNVADPNLRSFTRQPRPSARASRSL